MYYTEGKLVRLLAISTMFLFFMQSIIIYQLVMRTNLVTGDLVNYKCFVVADNNRVDRVGNKKQSGGSVDE